MISSIMKDLNMLLRYRMEGINAFLFRIKYRLIWLVCTNFWYDSSVPIVLHPWCDHLARHLLIAIDTGLLSLEYIFHYVAIALRLLRQLYLIVEEDSHFGYFASQNARSIINQLYIRFAINNQAERQSFFPIALPTHSITPLQETNNFDNFFPLTFILLARLDRFWKTFFWKIDMNHR